MPTLTKNNSPIVFFRRPVEIRPLNETDSIETLTGLLHAAYAGLAKQGFNYTAVDQTPDVTRERIKLGKCFVAVAADQVVGTITFQTASQTSGSAWFDRPDVACFKQFAVWPQLQMSGIGGQLLSFVQKEAAQSGARELALDTAEGAIELVNWYKQHGFRPVDSLRWPGKAYQSVVLSKTL